MTGLLVGLMALAAYLAGSVPFGLIIGKLVAGVDLRTLGSGNIGATNVGRTIGKKWGILCLVLDALKGMLPVAILPRVFQAFTPDVAGNHLAVVAAIATVVGHMFPCWLGFRGGKGVATGLGVAAILAPWGLLAALVVFAITFLVSRYVSLASMLAATSFAIYEMTVLQPQPFSGENWSLAGFSIAVPLLIIVQHRQNIHRLLRGEETRFEFGKRSPSETITTENSTGSS